jgi:hypothetical protein
MALHVKCTLGSPGEPIEISLAVNKKKEKTD